MAYDPENEDKTDQPEGHTDPPWPEPATAAEDMTPLAYVPETTENDAGATVIADDGTSDTADDGDDDDASDDSDAPIQLADANDPAADELNDAGSPGMTGDVRAETVNISQGGANSVEAETVSITQGGAAQVRAAHLSVREGGVALARTENLTIGESGSAFAVMADSATVEEGGNVFMLIARSVGGDVRPMLDWRAALAFGAGLAVVLRLLRRR